MRSTHDHSGGDPEPRGPGAVVHPVGVPSLIHEHYHRLEALAKRRALADADGAAANATALCVAVLDERSRSTAGLSADAEREARLRAALELLAREHPQRAECLTLHSLAGLGTAAVADLLGIAEHEVQAHVDTGRRWLAVQMR